jgi:DNA-binding beta-propeller fold protein YncE
LARVAGCSRAAGFTNPQQGVATSPDGSYIYLPSGNDSYFGALYRDSATGRLTQPTSPLACWKGSLATTDSGSDPLPLPCQPARGLAAVTRWVATSPDGRSVYVASGPENEGFGPNQTEALASFARSSDGALTQLPGSAGCISSAPLDDCAVLPGTTAQSVSVSPDARHVYVGGNRLTLFARDPATGALTRHSCLSATPMPPCGSTPLGLPLHAPVFTAAGRFAYALGEHLRTGSIAADTEAILGFAVDPGTGTLTPLGAPGGCETGYSALASSCTLDPRLGADASRLAPSPTGTDLYLTTSPISYPLPAAYGTPFQTLSLRLDQATGAMSSTGAACLSSVRRPRCQLDRGLSAVGDLAPSPDGRRLYGVTDTGVIAFVRRTATGALRRLGLVIRGCGNPFVKCPRPRQPINEPHQILTSPDGHFVYVVSSSFADTGTVAALAVR